MAGIEISIVQNADAETRDAILGGLIAYNRSKAGDAAYQEVIVLARDDDKIVGGLTGCTNWNWLFIAQLWVAEEARAGGVGRRLIEAAEETARARGCRHAHVDTFSFQALPFYERLGYTIFGQLEDYPAGHTRYFLQKRDLAADTG